MLESVDSDKTNYMVYKYLYNRTSMLYESVQRFIYDKNTNLLIDMDNPEYGCQITEYKDEKNKTKYLCNHRLIKDIENDRKKINKLKLKQ